MKTTHQVTVDHSISLELKELNINGEEYNCKITNMGGNLIFAFIQKGSREFGFEIFVQNGNVRISRVVYRPNHDHNDREEVKTLPTKFGAVTVNY